MTDISTQELYKKVDLLIRQCERLQAENSEYKLREQQLIQECQRLSEKNDQARTRVEAMIGHLKQLQQSAMPGSA